MVDLWQELADHHRELSPLFEPAEDSRETWSKYLAKKFSEKSTKLFVAAEDHHLVGFMLCMLSPNAPIFKERTIGLISDVYVRPERRRKGITREMLRAALKWFHKNKCKTVSLTVAAANFEARAVWGQLGFKPHMIHKRLDISGFPARGLLTDRFKPPRRKVVRKTTKSKDK